MNNLFDFMLSYAFLILIGSLSITGWFFITRGRLEVMPDGTMVRKGKIFKAWYFFWTREKLPPIIIKYKFRQLEILCSELRNEFLNQADPTKFDLVVHPLSVYLLNEDTNRRKLGDIEQRYNIFFIQKGNGIYEICKHYPNYVYPEWVRDPLAVCSTCFASIYGSVFYWSFIGLSGDQLFLWATSVVLAKIFFWVVFCMALAVVNTALAKKFN